MSKNLVTMPTLRTSYRIHPAPGDKRVTLTIPIELFEDLQKMAGYNQRAWKEELWARVRATLLKNDILMRYDRLMLMIFNKKLASKD